VGGAYKIKRKENFMSLIRWQRPESTWPGFEELEELRREMDRFLETPFAGMERPQFFRQWAPAVDLYEDNDHFHVRVEIPGMKKEDIDVSLHDHALTISGERKYEEKREGQTHRTERFHGRFSRTVMLPIEVKGDKVGAQYKDGVLTISLPKAEEAKPKQIEVKVA
jgi:HSP20 family protein